MYLYKKLVLDGNDGTGKSSRAKAIQEVLGIEVSERGPLSKLTDCDEIFSPYVKEGESIELSTEALEAINEIKNNTDTLYAILDAPVIKCQQHIVARGDSLDAPYHNFRDLCYYRERFKLLYDFLKKQHISNIFLVETKSLWIDCITIHCMMSMNEPDCGKKFFEYYKQNISK